MVQIYIYFSKIPNPLHKVPHFIYAKIKKDFLVKGSLPNIIYAI